MDGIGRELLGDEDFTRMLQNPVSAIPQAVEYVAQVVAEKNATLVSLTDDADLLVAGMTEQVPAANVAEYRRIPLAALHFFPSQILQPGSPQGGATTHADRAQRQALGLPEEPRRRRANRWRSRRTTSFACPRWRPNGRLKTIGGPSSAR